MTPISPGVCYQGRGPPWLSSFLVVTHPSTPGGMRHHRLERPIVGPNSEDHQCSHPAGKETHPPLITWHTSYTTLKSKQGNLPPARSRPAAGKNGKPVGPTGDKLGPRREQTTGPADSDRKWAGTRMGTSWHRTGWPMPLGRRNPS